MVFTFHFFYGLNPKLPSNQLFFFSKNLQKQIKIAINIEIVKKNNNKKSENFLFSRQKNQASEQ